MNVGKTDVAVRVILGIILIAVGFFSLGGIGTTPGTTAIVVGAILGATGVFSFCPVYRLFGVSTISSRS